eukprot:TRINITY_DN918_c1_g5_i1.p1 TRINITY_DN918_c1_g5~~TRINITY_DN918_c1_g5_i1.p1  ORF type:complete len:424 (-),score=141.95 TRINITY_DN918_c1_g5_i1:63-1280(-)
MGITQSLFSQPSESNNSIQIQNNYSNELSPEEEILLREQCTRTISLLGEEGFEKFRKTFVVIVGLGGIGSHIAQTLGRSGIGKIRLVDGSRVSHSTLKSHAFAEYQDAQQARFKVCVVEDHLRKILPHINIERFEFNFNANTADLILSGNPDVIIDCIGVKDRNYSYELVINANRKNLYTITTLGALTLIDRCDVSKFRFEDISAANLSSYNIQEVNVKNFLINNGVHSNVAILYSIEKFEELETNENNIICTMSSYFANVICAYVIMYFAGKKEKLKINRNIKLISKKIFSKFLKFEIKYHDHEEKPQNNEKLNMLQIEFIIEKIWNGRCAKSYNSNIDQLVLVRWDKFKKAAINNLILLTEQEAENHYLIENLEILKQKSEQDANFVNSINETLNKFINNSMI